MTFKSDLFKIPPEELKVKTADIKSHLHLSNDEVKPMAGTDLSGQGTHQYIRLAIVSTKTPPFRNFVCFVESNWLKDKVHDLLGDPDWLRTSEWDERWNFIEELLRKPLPGDTLNQYTRQIPEDLVWLAVYEYLQEQGILTKSVKKYFAETYGIPQ